jgi:hypothetical protein
MAGAAISRHCEIQKYDGSSENFAKSKGKCPEKTKWRKSVSGNVCLGNPVVVIDETDTPAPRTLLLFFLQFGPAGEE